MHYHHAKFLLVGGLLLGSSAQAVTCRDLLLSGTNYVAEVARSGGMRLFLKPAEPRSIGFIRPANQRASIVSWVFRELPLRAIGVKDRQLHLFSGFTDHLVREPIIYISDRTGLGRKELTIPSLVLLSALSWQGIDVETNQIFEQRIKSQVEFYANEYDELIKYDFRFHEIAQDLSKGELTQEEARTRAFWRKMAIDKYYAYRQAHLDKNSLNDQVQYLDFFSELKTIFEKGIQAVPGYRVPTYSRGPISEEKKLKLFDLSHKLYEDYQKIAMNVPTLEDPIEEKIRRLQTEGAINPQVARYTLQEFAFWRFRFAEFELLGIIKLSSDREGAPSLTLDDVRQEILDSLDIN